MEQREMTKRVIDPNCKTCDGSGIIIGERTIPVCCNNILADGSCCGVPDPEREQFQERCPECAAYEDAMNDSILK